MHERSVFPNHLHPQLRLRVFCISRNAEMATRQNDLFFASETARNKWGNGRWGWGERQNKFEKKNKKNKKCGVHNTYACIVRNNVCGGGPFPFIALLRWESLFACVCSYLCMHTCVYKMTRTKTKKINSKIKRKRAKERGKRQYIDKRDNLLNISQKTKEGDGDPQPPAKERERGRERGRERAKYNIRKRLFEERKHQKHAGETDTNLCRWASGGQPCYFHGGFRGLPQPLTSRTRRICRDGLGVTCAMWQDGTWSLWSKNK